MRRTNSTAASKQLPTHNMLVVLGDLNAKIGNENAGLERVMGKDGRGTLLAVTRKKRYRRCIAIGFDPVLELQLAHV